MKFAKSRRQFFAVVAVCTALDFIAVFLLMKNHKKKTDN